MRHEFTAALKIPFGLTPSGHLYEPLQVPNGNACGCVCPGCRQPLQAVHSPSGKVTPYFRHQTDTNCSAGYETAIHLAAKQLIAERQAVWCPAVAVMHTVTDALGLTHALDREIYPPLIPKFSAVRLEQWLPDIARRPDILAEYADHADFPELLIEIAVTHPTDDEKIQLIARRGTPTIEISVEHLHRSHVVDFALLADLLFKPSEHVQWLHHPAIQHTLDAFLADIKPMLAYAQKQFQQQADSEEQARQQERISQARKREHDAKFRNLTVTDKQTYLEKHFGSAKSWPAVVKAKNKHHEAIDEPVELWQPALYFKFIHDAKPRQTEFILSDALRWLKSRFHCVGNTETLTKALRYFLKVLANNGVLERTWGDAYLVICNDPTQFHRIEPSAGQNRLIGRPVTRSPLERDPDEARKSYAKWLKGTHKDSNTP